MAMPTEEKKVVKKVVIQPDGTKKVVKKIIKKVPKKEGAEDSTPVEVSSPIEQPVAVEEPIVQERASTGSIFRPTDEDIPSFPSDTGMNFSNNEEQYPEIPVDNSTSAELFKEDPIEETQEESVITAQENIQPTENQEIADIQPESDSLLPENPAAESTNEIPADTQPQNENVIDMGDLNQDNQVSTENIVSPEEVPASVETPEQTTLDMNSFLSATPAEDSATGTTFQPAESVVTETPTLGESTEAATAPVDLNQMIAQPQEQGVAPIQQNNVVGDVQGAQESSDPFMAMKMTLGEEAAQEQAATLDLNSMVSQENPQQPQEVANQGIASETPTLDLNSMPSELGTAPITSNVLKNLGGVNLGNLTLGGIKLDDKKKKLLTIGASCLGVVVLAAMVFIRYPDMFAGGGEEIHGSAPTNPTDWTQTPEPTTQEPVTTQDPTTEEPITTQEPETGDNQGTTTQPSDEVIIKPKDPVVVGDDDFFKDDKDIPTVVLDETMVNPKTSTGAVDPLGEVTGLIGELNGSDTIKQEALEYKEKGRQLRDKGASKNDRTIMRYGTFVEGKSSEIIQALEKGENIDISTWITQKAQFDEYLQKGNDA